MKYEQPMVEVIEMEAEDVITLSVGGADYDPTIDKVKGDSSQNPWA